MGHRLAQPGGEGADTARQESSEPHSLAVPSQGDHAQALLTTPGPQVRPAQLALTSHSYRLGVGASEEGRDLSAKGLIMWGTRAWRRLACGPPQTVLRLLPSLWPPLSQNVVTSHVAMLGALVTSQ